MIRRTTPNKRFSTFKTESSCCGYNQSQELKTEQKVVLTNKKKPLKLALNYNSNTVSTACHPEDRKIQFITFAPRNVHSYKRNHSNTAKTILSAACQTTTITTHCTESPSRMSPMPVNPLEKLNKRLKSRGSAHPSVARRLSWGTPNTTVTLSHLTSMKQDLNPEQLSILTSFAKAKDLETREYQKLKQEIKKFKGQYLALLKEEQALKLQRQLNREMYQALLTELYQKQQELKQSAQMRRLQLQQLKFQIEALLLSKEERIQTE